MTASAIPRDKNTMFQDAMSWIVPLPTYAATTTSPLVTPSTKARLFQIERVEIMVDATYASDATNYYVFTLEHGSGPTTAATWSTLTGAEGTLTGGTPGVMTLSAAANLIVPANDVVSLLATKHSAGANVTPRIAIHGHYL